VEARFISEALRHGYKVLKPWGDSLRFERSHLFRRADRASAGEVYQLPGGYGIPV
jgi:hypothetical protein